MGELIGQVNPDFMSRGSAPRDLVKLDKQARSLENSGLAIALELVVDNVPKSSFYYSDNVGIYPDGERPGYVLQIETTSPLPMQLGIIVSSSGTNLEVSGVESIGNLTRRRANGPSYYPWMGRPDPSVLFQYMNGIGLISTKEKSALNAELTRSRYNQALIQHLVQALAQSDPAKALAEREEGEEYRRTVNRALGVYDPFDTNQLDINQLH